MEITKLYLTPNKYSRPMTALKKVTKIAVHYIGNAGTSALANRNYFNSLANGRGVYASSHYIIGLDGEIVQCVPETEVAYCTNDANYYSISIENCHPYSDGKFTDKTLKSLIELCADLCKRYKLDPLTDIIRHYDVTGKKCPLWWVMHPEEFYAFKHKVAEYIKNGGIDMEELKKLQEENLKLKARVDKLEQAKEKVFDKLSDVPKWGKPTVEKLIDKGVLNGDGKNLALGYSLLRLLVINDRCKLYD